MNFDPFAFVLILAVLGVFLLIMISSQKKLEIEKDEKPLYTSTAGGQIGWVSYNGPFVNLRIYNEFVIISYNKKIVLRYDDIIAVEIKQWMGLVADRVQIIHRNPIFPKDIIIGTYDPAQVKEIIDARLGK